MFHTFQAAAAVRSPAPGEGGDAAKSTRAAGSRRISTSNACVECRRRKIRCDGTQPCGQCLWYQHPEACSYAKPAQRVIPSRKLVDKLSGQVEQYKLVLHRLFPAKDLDSLTNLPREGLINLALTLPDPSATSPISSVPPTVSAPTPDSEGGESLEAALEAAPDENPEWDEARRHQIRIQGISDDVNGLSLSVDRPSSYVGVSSITAALKVIVKIAPIARPYIDVKDSETTLPSRSSTPPPDLMDPSPAALPPVEVALELLDHYFEKVHPFFPMVDEDKFRASFLHSNRMDSAWLSLLNMVFALGSLSSSTASNEAHYVYFNRSRHYVSLETFGSGNLEVLQALGMMSGYYMHYLNRPNEANCLMGATLRMATGLGLHREYSEPASNANDQSRSQSEEMIAETRRRTWWSIFCLDVWASTTTSKPSLGRISSAVTVQAPGRTSQEARSPQRSPSAPSPFFPQPSNTQSTPDLRVLPLIHNVDFCKIGTRIQDRLATVPLLQFEELVQIDNDLVAWYDNLPSILSNHSEPCPIHLRVPRSVMKWRYQNLRIVLHRPFLLSTALRRASFAHLSAEEKIAVGKCRVIACQTISDISAECTADLISGWNGVWFAFQACIVVLVSLFADISNTDDVDKWHQHIELALAYFDRMRSWSVAAKKSKDAIARLYEASKISGAALHHASSMPTPHPDQHLPDSAPTTTTTSTALFPSPHDAQPFGAGGFPVSSMPGASASVNGLSMAGTVWDPQVAGSSADLGNLSGFWDEMMWDTSFPEIPEDPFGV
ncbi:hypothetical protein K490DRAFT_11732, partial [Saccharata proteae CBS 121410]